MKRIKAVIQQMRSRTRGLNKFVGAFLIAGMIASLSHAALVADDTGRWKDDGNGGCYWDENDSGPDQCDPNNPSGRWKISGAGCYWDGNDSGPAQCDPEAEDIGPEICGDNVCSANETTVSCATDCGATPPTPTTTPEEDNAIAMIAAMQAAGALTGNAEDMDTLINIFEAYGYAADEDNEVENEAHDTRGPVEGSWRDTNGDIYWMWCTTKGTKLDSARKTLSKSEKLTNFLVGAALIPRIGTIAIIPAIKANQGTAALRALVNAMQEWPCAF